MMKTTRTSAKTMRTHQEKSAKRLQETAPGGRRYHHRNRNHLDKYSRINSNFINTIYSDTTFGNRISDNAIMLHKHLSIHWFKREASNRPTRAGHLTSAWTFWKTLRMK